MRAVLGGECRTSILTLTLLLSWLSTTNCQLIARPYDKAVQEFRNPENGVALLCCERIILSDGLTCRDLTYSWSGPRAPADYKDGNLYLAHKKNIFEEYTCTAIDSKSEVETSVNIQFTVDHERDEPKSPSYALFYTLIALVFVFTGLCLFAVIYNYCFIFKAKVAQDEEAMKVAVSAAKNQSSKRDQLPLPVPVAAKVSHGKDSAYETMPQDIPSTSKEAQKQQRQASSKAQQGKSPSVAKKREPEATEPKGKVPREKPVKVPGNKVAPAEITKEKTHSPKQTASKQSKRAEKSESKKPKSGVLPSKDPGENAIKQETKPVEEPTPDTAADVPLQQTNKETDEPPKPEPTDLEVKQPSEETQDPRKPAPADHEVKRPTQEEQDIPKTAPADIKTEQQAAEPEPQPKPEPEQKLGPGAGPEPASAPETEPAPEPAPETEPETELAPEPAPETEQTKTQAEGDEVQSAQESAQLQVETNKEKESVRTGAQSEVLTTHVSNSDFSGTEFLAYEGRGKVDPSHDF